MKTKIQKPVLSSFALVLAFSTLLIFVDDAFAPPSEAPTADINADPENANVDQDIEFDGTGSSDPDGTIVMYEWDFDYPKKFSADASGEFLSTTTYSYSDAGTYTVGLRVTDDEGKTNIATRDVVISEPTSTTYYVRPASEGGDDGNSGLSEDDAFETISWGINVAVDGDTVVVLPGTYHETINFIDQAITLTSSDPDDWDVVEATVIDANGLGDTVTFDSSEGADSVITGFKITGTYVSGDYGILCDEASPVISKCIITGNFIGIYGFGGSSVVVDACKIHNTYRGILFSGGSPTVKNCWIYENDQGIGLAGGSSPTITNNTIVDNPTDGIFTGPGGGTPTITNCIIWSIGDDLDDSFTATYSCIEDGDAGTGNISTDPCFVDATNDDYHLSSYSPCIDAGDPDFVAGPDEKDIDGDARVINDRVDMGADEYLPPIYVDENASGNDDGSSWTHAYYDLQDALAIAQDGGQIWVAEGTYNPGANTDDSFVLVEGVSLYGGFQGEGDDSIDDRDWEDNVTTLDGNDNNYHVVEGAADATIDGFTIQRGNAGGSDGGGMYNSNIASGPIVRNCTFTLNSATNGAAIYNEECDASISKCTFSANYSTNGGAIYNRDANPKIINCTIIGNAAAANGGGVYNDNSAPVFINCRFSGNWAGREGKGSAGSHGGAMYNYTDSCPELVNCTITSNQAGTHGGGLYLSSGTTAEATIITNCIFWGNDAKEASSLYEAQIFKSGDDPNPIIRYSCIQGLTETEEGNIDDYPDFVLLTDPPENDWEWNEGVDTEDPSDDYWEDDLRNYRLADVFPVSPCVDTGDTDALPDDYADLDGNGVYTEPTPYDLDCNPRVFDGDLSGGFEVDMGAYEHPKLEVSISGPSEITLPMTADLIGSVQGLEDIGLITKQWSVNIPAGADVTFSPPDELQTEVQFGEPAEPYTLQLACSVCNVEPEVADHIISVYEEITVDAGDNQNIPFGDDAIIDATVSGGRTSTRAYHWTALNDPGGIVGFDPCNLEDTVVSFDAVGTYELQLSVTDGILPAPVTDTVTINVYEQLSVDAGINRTITLPKDYVYLSGIVEGGTQGQVTQLWSWEEDESIAPGGVARFDNDDPASKIEKVLFTDPVLEIDIPVPGTYIFKLEAVDTATSVEVSDKVAITIESDGYNNLPEVDAGDDYAPIDWADTQSVDLDGTVDDDLSSITPPETEWSLFSAEDANSQPVLGATVTFTDYEAIDTTATFSMPAFYTLMLTADDGDHTPLAFDLTTTIEVTGLFRTPPTVNAGPDQNFTRTPMTPFTIPLSAASVDPPNPPTGSYTYAWSYTGEVGGLSFSDSSQLNPTVTFYKADIYSLTLTVEDDKFTVDDSLQISIDTDPGNSLFNVSAGPDQEITQPAKASLDEAEVTDASTGQPYDLQSLDDVTWLKVSGPGDITFDPPDDPGNPCTSSELNPTASFSKLGTYTLRLECTEGSSSDSNEIQITVNPGTKISTGEDFSLIIDKEHNVWATGSNRYGQLGIGQVYWDVNDNTNWADPDHYDYFVPVTGEDFEAADIVSVSGGSRHSQALDSEGNVWSWGKNEELQLGIGDPCIHHIYIDPVKVLSGEQSDSEDYLENIISISAGRSGAQTLALDSDGHVWSWGRNADQHALVDFNSRYRNHGILGHYDLIYDDLENNGFRTSSLPVGVNGPIQAYWSFDEKCFSYCRNVIDDSGNRYYGTWSSSLSPCSYIDGKLGKAFELRNPPDPCDYEYIVMDGGDNCGEEYEFRTGIPYKGIAGDAPRTVCCWLKENVSGVLNGTVISWGAGPSPGNGENWELRINSNSSVILDVGGATASAAFDGASDWTHIAVAHESGATHSDVKIYINGIEKTVTYDPDPIIETVLINTVVADLNVLIGSSIVTGPDLNGCIDDVQIYDFALSSDQIADLCAEPRRLPLLEKNIVGVAAGAYHSMVLEKLGDSDPDSQGRVYAFGANRFRNPDFYSSTWWNMECGQLGDGDDSYSWKAFPTTVVAPDLDLDGDSDGDDVTAYGSDYLRNIVAIAAGSSCSIALEKLDDTDPDCNGRVYTWGKVLNSLGVTYEDGGETLCIIKSNVPVMVHSGEQSDSEDYLEDIVAVSAGENHFMALDRCGNIWTWGANNYGFYAVREIPNRYLTGQLGDGYQDGDPNYYQPTPVQVVAPDLNNNGVPDDEDEYGSSFLEDIIEISAGYWHSLAMDGDGKIWAWGLGENGRLGIEPGRLDFFSWFTQIYCKTLPVPSIYGERVHNKTRDLWYKAITPAIEEAVAGNTIVVYPGKYVENLTIDVNSLVITSVEPYHPDIVAKTIIDGTAKDEDDYSQNTFTFTDNTGCELKGLTIKGLKSGVCCYDSNSITISNNRILSNSEHGIQFYYNSSGNIVSNLIQGNLSDGIRLNGTQTTSGEIIISNNEIIGNLGYGILCAAYADITIKNNMICENGFVTGPYGIYLVGGTGVRLIYNNTLVNNAWAAIGHNPGTQTADVANCILWGKYASYPLMGLGADDDPNNLWNEDDPDITDPPSFVNAPNFRDRTNAVVATSNTLEVNDGTLYETGDIIEYDNDNVIRQVILDEDPSDNTITFEPVLSSGITERFTLVFNWGPDVTDITPDYHLQSDSPCIDQGTDTVVQPDDTDIDDGPRIIGDAVDIGADETISGVIVEAGENKYTTLLEPDVEFSDAYFLAASSTAAPSNFDIAWSVVSAPEGVDPATDITFDPCDTQVKATATFPKPGFYRLVLKVSDKTSGSALGWDFVTVVVNFGVDIDQPYYLLALTQDQTTGQVSGTVDLPATIEGVESQEDVVTNWLLPEDYEDDIQVVKVTNEDPIDLTMTSTATVNFFQSGLYGLGIDVSDSHNVYDVGFDDVWVLAYFDLVDVHAGSDQTVYLSGDFVVADLAGSVSGGVPSGTKWYQIAGPADVREVDGMNLDGSATFTQPGEYVLALIASDSDARAIGTDLVTITVETLQVAVDAGTYEPLLLPDTVLNLRGTVTGDGVASTEWVFTDSRTSVTFGNNEDRDTWVKFDDPDNYPGIYRITLLAKDIIGDILSVGTTDIQVYEDNTYYGAPVTITPASDTISLPESVFLDGEGGTGLPEWIGPDIVMFDPGDNLDTTASFTVPGDYSLALTTDDAGNITADTVQITVNEPEFIPIANVSEELITLPVDTVNLYGTVSEGITLDVTMQWYFDGPTDVVEIAEPEPFNGETTATFTLPGKYVIQLQALLSDTVIARDTVIVTVTEWPVKLDAGPDQDLLVAHDANNFPVELQGEVMGDRPDNMTVEWKWHEDVSVDYTPPLTGDPNYDLDVDAQVSFLSYGQYGVRLLAYDNQGTMIGYDDMIVTTSPDPASIEPMLEAGPDISVTPDEAELGVPITGASTSTGPDPGTLVWSSEDDVSFDDETLISPTIFFGTSPVTEDTYTIKLSAEFGALGTITDTMKIYVTDSDPVINLGSDQDIILKEDEDLYTATAYLDEAYALYVIPGMTYQWLCEGEGPANADITFDYPSDNIANLEATFEFTEDITESFEFTLTLTIFEEDPDINPDTQSWSDSMIVTVHNSTYTIPTDYEDPNIPIFEATHEGSPVEGQDICGQIDISILAQDVDSGIQQIELYLDYGQADEELLKTVTGSPVCPAQLELEYTLHTFDTSLGEHTLTAIAYDNAVPGEEPVSSNNDISGPITFDSINPTTGEPPVAVINNLPQNLLQKGSDLLPLTVVSEGLFVLTGSAYHPNELLEVQYKVELFKPQVDGFLQKYWSDPKFTVYRDHFIKDLTSAPDESGWAVGGINNGPLGQLDFTGVPNGSYQLLLTVRTGASETYHAYANAGFILDCPLKIGNVQFSQEDMVVPAGGIPLRVVRTYNSLNKDIDGDFGHGWQYHIADMDIELDEDRVEMHSDDYYGCGDDVSIRFGTNFNRNVTLTLPDGRRVTFLFYLEFVELNEDGEGTLPHYIARYQAPPGVNATLQTDPQERLTVIVSSYKWDGQGVVSYAATDPELYDFEGYKLITEDGTQYIFECTDDYSEGEIFEYAKDWYWTNPRGPLYLSEIRSLSGEKVLLNTNPVNLQIGFGGGVEYYLPGEATPAKEIEVIYDPNNGRIAAINAPEQAGEPNGPPTLKYIYDEEYGNLIEFHKLVDMATEEYEITRYYYEGDGFTAKDHYITDIKDPRGLKPIRYEYNDAGQLVRTIDAKDNTIEITHDVSGGIETVRDRHGVKTEYYYNKRGNVSMAIKYDATDTAYSTTWYEYGVVQNPDLPTLVTRQVPDFYTGELIDVGTEYTYTYYDNGGDDLAIDKIYTEKIVDPVLIGTGYIDESIETINTYDETHGRIKKSIQSKASSGEEISTSKYTYYENTYLPKTTEIWKGTDIESVSLNLYNGSNQIEHVVTIDVTSVTDGNIVEIQNATSLADLIGKFQMVPIPGGHTVTTYFYEQALSNSYTQPYKISDPYLYTDTPTYSQYFHYDINGGQDASWYYGDSDSDGIDDKRIINLSILDSMGRAIKTYRVVDDTTGNINDYLDETFTGAEATLLSETKYNSIGKVDYTIDQNGMLTKYEYDQTGNLMETLVYESVDAYNENYYYYPFYTAGVLSISQTLYDAEGRAIVSVGPFDPTSADLPVGTETVYDEFGRVVETRRWNGVYIQLVNLITNYEKVGRTSPGGITVANATDIEPTEDIGWQIYNGSVYNYPVVGNELSYTYTVYDIAGRVKHSITVENVWDDTAMDYILKEQMTTYEYDLAGRQITVIDPQGHDIELNDLYITAVDRLWDGVEHRDVDQIDFAGFNVSQHLNGGYQSSTEYDGTRRDSVIDALGNETSFTYDALGRIITTTYPPTNYTDETGTPQTDQATYTHISYDGLGRKEWDAGTVSYLYDEPVEVPDSEKKYYSYDIAGRLIQVTLPDPEGGEDYPVYDYIYDDNGNQVGIIDPKLRLTVFKFDHMNRQTHKYMPFVITEVQYNEIYDDETSLVTEMYDLLPVAPEPDFQQNWYDSLGRIEEQKDYKGQYTVYQYYDQTNYMNVDDFLGKPGQLMSKEYYDDFATPVHIETHTYTYDSFGRTVDITHTDEATSTDTILQSFDYDTQGRIANITTPEGVANYEYNPVTGRKISTWTGMVSTAPTTKTEYTYDEMGRLGETILTWRDGTELTTPEVTTYDYTDVGSRASTTLANDVYTKYTYNAMNRLTNLTNWQDSSMAVDTEISSFEYTLKANGMRAGVVESVDENHDIGYTYDDLNRLTDESNFDNTATYGYEADYIYDLSGNRKERKITLSSDDGQGGINTQCMTTTYNYDSDPDRLTSEVQIVEDGPCAMIPWRDNKYVYAYAGTGTGGGVTYKLPGIDVRIGQFGAFFIGLPSVWSKYLLIAALILIPLTFFGPVVLQVYRRLRRLAPVPVGLGRPLSLRQRCMCVFLAYVMLLGPSLQQMAYAEMQYDYLNTDSWGSDGDVFSYCYDANGSLEYKFYGDVDVVNYTPQQIIDDNLDVAYDHNIYNLQNRLAGIEKYDTTHTQTDVVEYKYNSAGIRIAKIEDPDGSAITTTYLIDPANHTGYAQTLEEWRQNGNTATLITYTLGDDVIAQTKSNWEFTTQWDQIGDAVTQYILYDGHGSTRQLVSWTGSDIDIDDTYSYDGYGVLLQNESNFIPNGGSQVPGQTPAQATNLLYAGEHFDADSQQYYNRARWYTPLNGRFNRMDPFAGNNQDPQSLHKYAYCYNNPINGIDPTGMFEFSISGLVQSMAINSLVTRIGMPIFQPAGRFIVKGFLGQSWSNFFNSDSWQHGASIFGFSGAKPINAGLSVTGALEALIGWKSGDIAVYAAGGISTPKSYSLNAYIGCAFNVKTSHDYNWNFVNVTFSLKMLPTKWQEKVMTLIAKAATKTTSPAVQQIISQFANKSISVMPLVNRILGNKTLNITLFGWPTGARPYGFSVGIGKAYGGTAKNSISVGWQLYQQIGPWREVNF